MNKIMLNIRNRANSSLTIRSLITNTFNSVPGTTFQKEEHLFISYMLFQIIHIITKQLMGSLFGRGKKKQEPQPKPKSQVQEVDIVKSKLKIAREKVNNYAKAKNKDIEHIDEEIKNQIPHYEETKSKKKLVPLLQAKKDLQKLVDNAQVRVKLINEKISEVQMNQLNMETVNALQDSNQYIQKIQKELEEKDWRGIIEDAKNKYEIEWPQEEEDLEDDPTFQTLWNQIGGNKIDKPQKKNVKVEIPVEKQQQEEKQQMLMN